MKKISISTSVCKRILTCFLLVFISLQLVAQSVTNYTFAASSGTFTALSTPTNPTITGGTDDGAFNAIPIGFDFWYMGIRYTTLSACTNGWMTFGSSLTNYDYDNDLSNSATGALRPLIAPLWDDVDVQLATNVSYKLTGSAPNRVFTLQYLNTSWQYTAAANSISFQVKLYEGTGKVEFVYRPEAGALATPNASIGITASGTGSGNFRSLNNSGTNPTASSTIETDNIATKPATGQTYSFTPAVPTAPANLTFSNVAATSMTLNWNDNSSNEAGFAIYRSTDGSTYTYYSQAAANSTSLAVSGLTASTTYYWRVYAVTEGALSTTYISGTQATTCAGPNISQIPATTIGNYKFSGNAVDEAGTNNGTFQNSTPTPAADRFSISNKAYTFNGTNQYMSTANSYVNPSTVSVSVWFKTTTSVGGVLIGFSSVQTGNGGNRDRFIYMTSTGVLYFGVAPGGVKKYVSTTASYNDGNWHLATGTVGAAGLKLYVDGVLMVTPDVTATSAENYTGYWRVGHDDLATWPNEPSSYYFDGTLDDIQIYHRELTSVEVSTLYNSPDGAGSNAPICIGNTLNLSATTVGSATYSWTGPNSFTSSSQNPSLTFTAPAAGVYTVSVTVAGCATPSVAYVKVVPSCFDISGKVFEDKNYGGGSGRSLATSSGIVRSGARVELFNSGGSYVSATTTDGSGAYTFSGLLTGVYTVRVVNSTVTSSRGGSSLLPVQTFRTDANGGSVVALTDRVGGQTPSLADAGNGSTTLAALTTGSTTAQSITTVNLSSSNLTDVDFGYSFNVIVNKNITGHGSLRQFITNSNALSNTGLAQSGLTAGIDNAVFMLADGTARPGLTASYATMFASSVASIAHTSALPDITDPVVIDATLQPGYTTVPMIELNGTSAGNSDGIKIMTGGSGSVIKGLSINRYVYAGISVSGADDVVVQANHLGVDPTGAIARANGTYGILLDTDANNNTIGGTSTAHRNIISGNTSYGILITSADGNDILGNHIGVNLAGTGALPNSYGIYLFNTSANNTIGGSAAGSRNTISGNTNHGIIINGSSNNTVSGNYIGTTAAGTAALANSFGVYVYSSSTNNTIGGSTSNERNIISGNTFDGVYLADAGTTANIVKGNYISTNAAGSAALPNLRYGVYIFTGATDNIVGGSAAGEGNLISGHGNLATVDCAIAIYGVGTTGNTVIGNYIGTNAAGTAALTNLGTGIWLGGGAASNIIGGTTAGERNIISGNSTYGVYVDGTGTSSNVIKGNYIGTNAAGTSAIANGTTGVWMGASSSANTVGGTAVGAGNLISGNTNYGIVINGITGNSIIGNYIGTNAAGTAALANTWAGVYLLNGATNNTIGGTTASARNIISGNTNYGVYIIDATTTSTTIQGNYIGTNAAGTAAVANGISGVYINTSSDNNMIGGTAAGAGNLISGNGAQGVQIAANCTGNGIISNLIYGNTGIGIDLLSVAAANNGTKTSTLANYGMDSPVFTTMSYSGTTLTLAGYVSNAAGDVDFANAVIQVFTSDNDGSTYGEGPVYLGTLTCGATNGDFSGSLTVASGLAIGDKITGIAYDATYNTSEFGLNATVTGVTKTFTGTGNFSDAARWTSGTLPEANNNLIIDGTCTVDNSGTTDNVQYGTLTIGTATGRTLSWATNGTNRLNVSNVAAGAGASTLNMTNGGTLIIRGTLTTTNLTFTPGAGTIEVQSTMTLPAAYATYNNLIVNGSSTTVTVGVNTTVNNNLTVTSGTFTVGAFSLAVTGTASVTSTMTITSATGAKSFGNLIINSTGTFTNTAAVVPITIAGNLQNDGIFSQGTGRVTFTGAASNTVTGTAATTAFGGGITVNKGTANTNVLDVQSVITMSSGGLTLTNGTFKLSSNSTITVFTADITIAPYLIPSTAGLWVNGGTVSTTSDMTLAGLIRVSNGVFNVGNAADTRLLSSWATLIIEGGAFNVTGRLTRRTTGEGHYITISGGILTVNTMGSTNISYGPFNVDDPGSTFTMSGGTIAVHMASSAPSDYTNLAGTYNVTGGILQIGDATTPASNTMKINSTVPVWNLLINGANSPVAQLVTNALTVKDDVTITSGTLNANNLNITVGGTWTNNVSTAAFTAGTATVTMNGTAAESISGSFATTFNNLTIATSNTVTANVNSSVTSNLLVSGGTLDLASFTANRATSGGTLTVSNGATLKIGGTNTLPSNYTTHSIGATSTIEYSGTTQSVIGLNSAQDYGHLIISGSGTKTLAGTEAVAGNLTLSAGTFNANNFNISVGGHWINNAGFTAGTGTVTFNGGGAQIVSGSQALNVFNLVTNNASGITLNTNLSVSGAHTFSAGMITTSAIPNYLIYAAGSSYAGSNDSRHVNGWVKKHGNTNFTFPVGDATYERAIAISNLSAVSEIDCYYYTPTQNIYNLTSPLIQVKANEYWQINRISGGTAQVTLNWAHAKVAMDNVVVTDILVANYSAGSWTSRGGTASGNVTTTGTITSTSTGTFGPFTLGYKTYPIPLKLLSFTAERRSGTSFLKWITENEENVDRFEIQRSYNGVLYLAIGNVPARNTSSLQHYLFEDHSSLEGLAYYRIRSIDIDGKFSYSNIAVVSENNSTSGSMVVLNPVHSTITILNKTGKSGLFGYRLFNAGGQLLITGNVSMSINGGTALPLPAAASSGTYILEMSYGSNRYRQKILVQ